MSVTAKIIFLAPYPFQEAPSQRFRFEQYYDSLKNVGYEYEFHPFLDEKTWKVLYQKGKIALKSYRVMLSFMKRFLLLFSMYKFDYVFVHREISHVGPPVFEWIIAKILRKKIIYDFDDAIWLPNFHENNARFNKLKYYQKIPKIIKWSYRISAGNSYLKKYAEQFNPNVVVNPTTIDTENYHNPKLFNKEKKSKFVIGWTGTATTMKYLHFLLPILKDLSKIYEFEFCIISNEFPKLDFPNLKFIKWKKESEIQDLLNFDVGVMPLTNDKWAKGKCGFKALQYMSLGIPAIVSPVGVNKDIVDEGTNGFIVDTEVGWKESLEYFLKNPGKTKEMSASARNKIVNHYSVESNLSNFLSLFE
jgi:glycosyltransferase involved in cell wall biosynthesis